LAQYAQRRLFLQMRALQKNNGRKKHFYILKAFTPLD
tara:strand:+ start:1000 stop:1110 length:111 start_codon:yes stop_codon:yes gene_type:complete